MLAAIPCTSSRAVASSARSALRRPFPVSLLTNSSIWPEMKASDLPWSLTIFRKKKSWAWIAVVPSYSESILASRMYCSIG
ncbi:Uncharacterised protein [Mycobacteroides abscessus subsp. abscessus]|nr:Uncharacterised protein [Mycobacteroides abscessus subsp. abscessus]